MTNPARASLAGSSILWRRLDREGHEACRLSPLGPSAGPSEQSRGVEPRDQSRGVEPREQDHGGWSLAGSAVFAHEGRPCRLDYAIACDAAWSTVSARVGGWIGDRVVDVEIAVDHRRRWFLNGILVDAVAGCLDVDLNFSPSTNLLPIRRLGLAVGAEAPVRAAWLRFPGFELELLEQIYRRTGRTSYRYESAGGRFTADLDVDESGFVTRYPGLCETVSGS